MKDIIFDFGNVLGQCYADCLTDPYVDDVANKPMIRDIVFDRLYFDKLDRGTITDEEVLAGICSRLPKALHKQACDVYNNWINTMIPMKKMGKVVSDLKEKGHKLYLLSNISIGFANSYQNIPWMKSLFDQFDGLVFSGTIGMVKPDVEIYEYVLNKFNLKAENCIFIDDSKANVEGSIKAGIEGYYFDGDVEKLRNHLQI